MNVNDLGTALIRRRLWAAAVVIIAVLAGGYIWSNGTAKRQSTAVTMVTAPSISSPNDTDITDKNPLLNIGSQLSQLASALVIRMQSDTVAADLAAAGGSGEFTVTNVSSDNPNTATVTPNLEFTVTGTDSAAILSSSNILLKEAAKQLAQLQTSKGAPANTLATLTTLNEPSTPVLVKSTKLKAAGSTALLVVLLGFLVIIIIDAQVVRRQARLRHHSSPTIIPKVTTPSVPTTSRAKMNRPTAPVAPAITTRINGDVVTERINGDSLPSGVSIDTTPTMPITGLRALLESELTGSRTNGAGTDDAFSRHIGRRTSGPGSGPSVSARHRT